MRLFAIFALIASAAFAETKAVTLHMTPATIPAAVPSFQQESVMVIITTDNRAIKAYRVTVTFDGEHGTESRTQTVDRATGQFIVSTAVSFPVAGAKNVKPAVVEPLASMPERVQSN